jgi:hypothetical protein
MTANQQAAESAKDFAKRMADKTQYGWKSSRNRVYPAPRRLGADPRRAEGAVVTHEAALAKAAATCGAIMARRTSRCPGGWGTTRVNVTPAAYEAALARAKRQTEDGVPSVVYKTAQGYKVFRTTTSAAWPRQPKILYGDESPAAKLTEDDVLAIREKAARGATPSELSRRYGVTGTEIGYIVRRKVWRHLS